MLVVVELAIGNASTHLEDMSVTTWRNTGVPCDPETVIASS